MGAAAVVVRSQEGAPPPAAIELRCHVCGKLLGGVAAGDRRGVVIRKCDKCRVFRWFRL